MAQTSRRRTVSTSLSGTPSAILRAIVSSIRKISCGTKIGRGVEVGSGAIVSAGGVVFESVAPKTFVRGNPATVVSKMRKDKTKEEKPATPNESRAVEKFRDT